MPQENIWREEAIKEGEPLVWDCGKLRFGCRIEKLDFWLSYRHFRDEEESQSEKVKALEEEHRERGNWRRWSLKQFYPKIRFEPLLPDRPVVIKPESPFMMTPGAAAKIYVRCPLWVSINLIDNRKMKIEELPTVALSDTWFGDFASGELCYWLSSSGRRAIMPNLLRPYLAVCPIQIVNGADEKLNVEKICLRVPNHALYTDKQGQLWAAEAKITYRGSATVSEIEVAGKAPHEAEGAQLTAAARVVRRTSIFARTFAAAKHFHVFGGND